ncbi:YgaP family membrane protein [Pseudooceanicola sp. 502str34]|uniref:YgaP family membrane protein n=1 Tax=Maritimibacter alkaliphilus TaxID=404236 RepID=UPI001C98B3EF|nr:DUF2892 domain-containing protein [Maritimibacter alkaliphilus]MBY6089153.1 DUF2892 domain-containing protein [Maritimibacter alkaliphilus]
MFAKNEGTADRVIRVVVGLALIAAFFLSSWAYAWIFLIGVVPLITGLMGSCPLYTILGINTCPLDRR